MLKLGTDFEKLFIDTNYVFDVSFDVLEKFNVTYSDSGKVGVLNNIIVTQTKEGRGMWILFNVEQESGEYFQDGIERFEDHQDLKREILKHINIHIEDLKYN